MFKLLTIEERNINIRNLNYWSLSNPANLEGNSRKYFICCLDIEGSPETLKSSSFQEQELF